MSVSLDTSRLIARAQLETADDRESRALTSSVRRQDMMERERQAHERYREAQAAAAQQQAASEALVLLPEPAGVEGQGASRVVSGEGHADPFAALEGVTIPPEVEARLQQVREALAQADALEAAGHAQVADSLRAAWTPIAEAIIVELAPASPAPPTFAPPNDYFDGDPRERPIGEGFFGVGDRGRTGQDSIYEWLPHEVEALARASTHGHFLLAASDEVTTVERFLAEQALYVFESTVDDGDNGDRVVTSYLTRDEAFARLHAEGLRGAAIEAYLAEHERFLMHPGFVSSEAGDMAPQYGTRAELLAAMGLPDGVPMDLQISFNNSGSGGGDAWLDRSHALAGRQLGTPERAYHALVDDELAADWVQIGDIGPLGDDVGKMLEEIFEQYGATTAEQREAIRGALFIYDERFGILANREFVEAAVETNNARRQGFFEGPVGRALLMVAASFIPGVGTYVSMALNAGFTLHDGGSFSDVVRGAVIGYFAGQFGAEFGDFVSGTFGSSLDPTLAAALDGAARNLGASAVRQLLTDGRVDGDALLAAALGGAVGGAVTSFVNDSDFGRALDLHLGPGRAGEILGRLAGSASDGRLSADELIGAFGGRPSETGPTGYSVSHTEDGTQIITVDTVHGTVVHARNGNQVYSLYPDGSMLMTALDPNGQPFHVSFDRDGNVLAQTNLDGSVIMGPNDGPQLTLDYLERLPETGAIGDVVDILQGDEGGEITPEMERQLVAELTALGREQREAEALIAAARRAEATRRENAEWQALGLGESEMAYWRARGLTPQQVRDYRPGNENAWGRTDAGPSTDVVPPLPLWSEHGELDTGATGEPATGIYMSFLPSSQSTGVAQVPNWIVRQFNELFGTDITPSWTQFHMAAYIDNPLAFAMAEDQMVIAGHGHAGGIVRYAADNYNGPQRTMGAAELAQLILSTPGYDPGMTIVLAACDTGRPGGVAEQLSRLLPNPIVGPPDFTRSNPITGTQYVENRPNNDFFVYEGGRLVGHTPVVYGQPTRSPRGG